ncbi:matrix metalloproteinase-18-like isoform X2 [Anneissia japonica]|nr:matrix metalloproteinase-18-like isoform X2 [Anneissia japonica]
MTSETRARMSQPRCGVRDDEPQQSLLRFAWVGTKWLSTSLTYSFLNYTTDIPVNDTREAIEAAFKLWSDVSPLRFTKVDPSSNPDINILFSDGEHGDNNPFDGPLGVLAHAFYPGPGFGGDAHFDEAENFTINGGPGIDLFQVAAHEFGHSLGLNHSSDPAALMWPYYSGYIPNFMLPQDDINGIQYIYGSNPDAPSTTSAPDNEIHERNEDCLCIRRKPDI